MKSYQVLCCAALLAVAQAQSYTPKEGYVPDSITAVKIGEAVLIPAYGKEKIESERPFKAVLENALQRFCL